MMPFSSLLAENRELGLILAVVMGFLFGFVLERAGFGRATKLAGQFYLHDMTVLKVMFSGIMTAMVGLLIASGIGLVEMKVIAESAASTTYLWPMLVGGLLLGVGFIVSGYCPGTSIVATASGNLDGLFAFTGVAIGSLVFAELIPVSKTFAAFNVSGDMGQSFFYQKSMLGLSAPLLAAMVIFYGVLTFFGAEWVEKWARKRRGDEVKPEHFPSRPKRLVFSGFGAAAVVAIALMALPKEPQAKPERAMQWVSQEQLAHRVLDEAWSLRIVDVRDAKVCAKKRIPGTECAPLAGLGKLGLAFTSGARDLVLVGDADLASLPAPAAAYPGKVLVLRGGFAGWKLFALTAPQQPASTASAADLERYRFRAALHAAMTGRKAPAPLPTGNKKYVPRRKKKKGGGCS